MNSSATPTPQESIDEASIEKKSIQATSLMAISQQLRENKLMLYGIRQALSSIENRVLGFGVNEAATYRNNLNAIHKLVKQNEKGIWELAQAIPNAFQEFLELVAKENLEATLAPYASLVSKDKIEALTKPLVKTIAAAKKVNGALNCEDEVFMPPSKSSTKGGVTFEPQIDEASSNLSQFRKAVQDIRNTIQTVHDVIDVAKDTIDLASRKASSVSTKLNEVKQGFRDLQKSTVSLSMIDADIRELIGDPFPLNTTPLFDDGEIDSALTDEGFAIALKTIAKTREPLQRLLDYAVLIQRFQAEIANKEAKMEKLLDRMRKDGGTVESDAARSLRKNMQTVVEFLKERQRKVLCLFFKGRKEILRKMIAATVSVDKCYPRVARNSPLVVEAGINNIGSSLRVLEELNERHTYSKPLKD